MTLQRSCLRMLQWRSFLHICLGFFEGFICHGMLSRSQSPCRNVAKRQFRHVDLQRPQMKGRGCSRALTLNSGNASGVLPRLETVQASSIRS